MTDKCENCGHNQADGQVMSINFKKIYDVCSSCRLLLVNPVMGFIDVTLGSSPTAKQVSTGHKEYSAGYDKGFTIKLKVCECGNSDKPMNTQLHSHWCAGYKREFL